MRHSLEFLRSHRISMWQLSDTHILTFTVDKMQIVFSMQGQILVHVAIVACSSFSCIAKSNHGSGIRKPAGPSWRGQQASVITGMAVARLNTARLETHLTLTRFGDSISCVMQTEHKLRPEMIGGSRDKSFPLFAIKHGAGRALSLDGVIRRVVVGHSDTFGEFWKGPVAQSTHNFRVSR